MEEIVLESIRAMVDAPVLIVFFDFNLPKALGENSPIKLYEPY